MHRTLRRAALSILLAGCGFAAVGAGPVTADDDHVAEQATVTYRLDLAHRRVMVTAKVRYTNRIPSTRTARYYLEQWGPIGIPADATRVRVSGSRVKVRRLPTGSSFDNLILSFPRIYNGGSVAFTVSWVQPSRGADSTAVTRVSDAYSHFCWSGQPVDSASVSVLLPRRLEVVTQGGSVRTSRQGSQRRLTARTGGDPATFYACTDVYDPDLLLGADLQTPRGHLVRLEALPGEQAWLDGTTPSVVAAMAGVEGVIGAAIPGSAPIRVREVPANTLQGYAGEFDRASGIIRVGQEGAAVPLLAHELAHAWFHAGTLSTNWLWEGLAEWTSREAVGRPCVTQPEYPMQGRPRLADWRVVGPAATFEEQALVAWQYEAACAVQGQVSERIGRARMQQVVAALLAGDSPYDALPEPATPWASPVPVSAVPDTAWSVTRSTPHRSKPVDWRQWLDLVDEIGLAPVGADVRFAEDLLVANGVVKRSQLAGRADARSAYHELQALAPGGISPALVRRDLDGWRFPQAGRDIRLARSVALAIVARPVDDPTLPELWSDYERATSRSDLERLRDHVPG